MVTPEPPPTWLLLMSSSRYTSAMTQVPTAKYPPRRRNASTDVGSAITPAMRPAMKTAMNGLTCRLSAITKSEYAPSPM